MKNKKIIMGIAAPVLAACLVVGFNGGMATVLADDAPSPTEVPMVETTEVPMVETTEVPMVELTEVPVASTTAAPTTTEPIEFVVPPSATYGPEMPEESYTTISGVVIENKDAKVVPSAKPEAPKTAYNDFNTFVDSFAKQLTLENDATLTAEQKEQKKAEENIKLMADPVVAEVVKNAPANTQVVNAGEWISAKRNFYEAVEKSGKNVTIVYYADNHRYSVTIPAGAKVTDLVNEEGYCGFLNLAAHYGATLLK